MTGMLDSFERSNGNLYLPEDNTDHVDQFLWFPFHIRYLWYAKYVA